jgi:hypothetical protein
MTADVMRRRSTGTAWMAFGVWTCDFDVQSVAQMSLATTIEEGP